jgi:TonB family protein
MKTEGSVSVRVEVNEQGNVARATAISGPPVLRPAAEDALKKWKFKPATLRGVNVKTELIIMVEFKR